MPIWYKNMHTQKTYILLIQPQTIKILENQALIVLSSGIQKTAGGDDQTKTSYRLSNDLLKLDDSTHLVIIGSLIR